MTLKWALLIRKAKTDITILILLSGRKKVKITEPGKTKIILNLTTQGQIQITLIISAFRIILRTVAECNPMKAKKLRAGHHIVKINILNLIFSKKNQT